VRPTAANGAVAAVLFLEWQQLSAGGFTVPDLAWPNTLPLPEWCFGREALAHPMDKY